MQERLFNPSEMAVSVREFVRAKLDFPAPTCTGRKVETAASISPSDAADPLATETQECLGFASIPEERKAQIISDEALQIEPRCPDSFELA
jgi:hypothetical protein